MSNEQKLNDDQLVILNNLLVKEIIQLKVKLDEENNKDSLALGEVALKDLESMHKEHQSEITKRGLSIEQPLEKMTSAKKLSDHIIKSNEAMTILLQHNHYEAFLILLFSWVDRLAWLSIENDDSSGSDFKSWLNMYLFIDTSVLPCNADDLWASRCGLLHTGTAESRDVKRNKARTIYYYGGEIEVTAKKPEEKEFVNINILHAELLNASILFLRHLNLEENINMLEITNRKLGKVLSRTTSI